MQVSEKPNDRYANDKEQEESCGKEAETTMRNLPKDLQKHINLPQSTVKKYIVCSVKSGNGIYSGSAEDLLAGNATYQGFVSEGDMLERIDEKVYRDKYGLDNGLFRVADKNVYYTLYQVKLWEPKKKQEKIQNKLQQRVPLPGRRMRQKSIDLMNKEKQKTRATTTTTTTTAVIGPSKTTSEVHTYDWLEDILGKDSLDWVKKCNLHALETIGDPLSTHKNIYKKILGALQNKDKIPTPEKIGDYIYNFWTDTDHKRGIWRRTTMEEYKKKNPKWEMVLDLDKLIENEQISWVWKGHKILSCPGEARDRTLLKLSIGGSDAVVIREFDLINKDFVSKDPFNIQQGKSRISWKTRDILLVSPGFGEGSLTKSGYPRIAKEWPRGTELSDAKVLYTCEHDDVQVQSYVQHSHGYSYHMLLREIDFYNAEHFILRNESFVKLNIPLDMESTTYSNQFLFTLKSDWEFMEKTYVKGSLIAVNIDDFLKEKCDPVELFTPSMTSSLQDLERLQSYIVLVILDNVKLMHQFWKLGDNGIWEKGQTKQHGMMTSRINPLYGVESDAYWMTQSGYLEPQTLYLCHPTDEKLSEPLKYLPNFFDSKGLHAQQFHAKSKDGTLIPYFCVSRKDINMNGKNPTLLYGYGGFNVSLVPSYSFERGIGWLAAQEEGSQMQEKKWQGGVYAVANIRGGGEFGPKWHQAALKEKRHKSYEDFIAVAEDLIQKKFTSKEQLGIWGGSNGGLLVGNMLTMRPDLFGAIICQVPLLDMQRYHKLLAGASWMAEYGDPDKPEEWKFLKEYSPFHNVDSSVNYPPIFFTTSTKDDRVHPAHARKMVKKLLDYGNTQTYYYENIEGGHSSGADNTQRAYTTTLMFMFLRSKLSQ